MVLRPSSKSFWLSKKEVREIFKFGKIFRTNYFSFYFKKNNFGSFRFSVIVPFKIFPKATKRNRIKRQIKEIVRQIFPKNKGIDLAIMLRPGYSFENFQELKEKIKSASRSFLQKL